MKAFSWNGRLPFRKLRESRRKTTGPEEEIKGRTTLERRGWWWRRGHSRRVTRPERSHQAIFLPGGLSSL